MYVKYGWVFLMAVSIALVTTPLVRWCAIRWGAIDMPNGRKIHHEPIPRLGGIGIYLAFVITALVFLPLSKNIQGILLGGTFIAILGIIDDFKELPAKVKLVGQILAALILIAFDIRIDFITNPINHHIYELGFWGLPLTVFWIVAATNTLNLIDGLDGLAAGVSSIASITLLIVALIERQGVVIFLTIILVGSALGFLKYNFNPAKIFMGDTGSMFLGFMLGAISILGLLKSATIIALMVSILALGLPIADTAFAIMRRLKNRQPIFQADKGHLHHRLIAAGLTQRQAVLLLYFMSALLGMNAIFLVHTGHLLFIQMLLVTLIFWSITFGIHRSFLPFSKTQAKEKKVES